MYSDSTLATTSNIQTLPLNFSVLSKEHSQ